LKTNTLFKRFIIQSIISFIITGSLLGFIISNSIVSQEINHNIEVVKLTLGHSLLHWFETVDLNALTSDEIMQLDVEFESLLDLGSIADIKSGIQPAN